MNRRWIARAPGKLFIMGEYAVLDGAPAVVAAVDRYVEVAVRLTKAAGMVRVAAPGYVPEQFRAAEIPPLQGPLRFVLAAYEAAKTRFPALAKLGIDVQTSSTLADDSNIKVGLGSSAAVTAGVIAGLSAVAGEPPAANRNAIFELACGAHRIAQGGVGSGADVAASVYGGVIRLRPARDGTPRVSPVAWPADALLLVGWSGSAADTADSVRRYCATRNGGSQARSTFVRVSRNAVAGFISALSQGTLSLSAIEANGQALERLGQDLQLPIITPTLQRLIALAREHGAAAKVSGAGGGDCGIALTTNPSTAERIRHAWQAAGIIPLPLQLDTTGVTIRDG